jgi:hypothetical protein
MEYNLEKVKLLSQNIVVDLPKDVINVINFLAHKVGAPSYKKTPIFKKRNNNHYNNHPENITVDDWAAIRNFKKTVINRNKEGISLVIDEIRCLLNKVTEKSYDEIQDKIFKKIEKSENDFGGEEFMSIGKLIFDIGSLNKYCSHLYARLYKELIDLYPIFSSISENNYKVYAKIFDEIRWINSEEDYNLYCDINKENENRKSLSLFFTNLMKHNVFNEDKIISIINNLIEKVDKTVQEENKVEVVEEIVSNLIIMILNTSTNFKDKEVWGVIKNHINKYSKAKKKNYNSLTTKIVFKYMDVIDKLNH